MAIGGVGLNDHWIQIIAEILFPTNELLLVLTCVHNKLGGGGSQCGRNKKEGEAEHHDAIV